MKRGGDDNRLPMSADNQLRRLLREGPRGAMVLSLSRVAHPEMSTSLCSRRDRVVK